MELAGQQGEREEKIERWGNVDWNGGKMWQDGKRDRWREIGILKLFLVTCDGPIEKY